MTVSSFGLTYVGPAEPENPVGEATLISEGVEATEYEDGTLIQISARRGEPLRVYPLPEGGFWSMAFETDDDLLVVSIWYPKGT